MDSPETFRQETRAWLEQNCPESQRKPASPHSLNYGGRNASFESEDAKQWMLRMAERGWTAPEWPSEYGGGGLSGAEASILKEEMGRLSCRPPLIGHGLWMLGPLLLEFGNDAQKQQHLPAIAKGKIRWCQGFSEPGAGSDLAALRCKAEDKGDHFLVNGSKTWTTDADKAGWIFCLVRTETGPVKQEGISFLLIDMQTPGVSVNPIRLLNDDCHFCETFFDNVKVPKENLVAELHKGWPLAKRLLQHERASMGDLASMMPKPLYTVIELAKLYTPVDADGRLLDANVRSRLTQHLMNQQSMRLTHERAYAEGMAGVLDMNMTTFFKYYSTEETKRKDELIINMLGERGLGWDEESFEDHEFKNTSTWLQSKVLSMGGGTSEVQLNIVAKRALGLPD
ncbi:MAG: acyl-CoA dehydrogenase family protein [Pseudomonadales bacterium]